MSEVDRPSASQDAIRAQQIADHKKQKSVEKTATQFGAQQQKGVGQDKKLQSSPFDEVLKSASEQGAQNFAPEAKFDSRLKEVQRERENTSSSDRDREDDGKDSKKKTEGSRESKENSAQSVKERVMAKHGSEGQKQDSGGGSGEQRDGRSGQGFAQKGSAARFQEAGSKKADLAPAPTPQMPKLDLQTAAQIDAVHAPRELPKAVLDQIVQYVRIGVNKELNKEIQIDFNDQVFNGLKLKVVSHGKEVSVEFTVPNRSALDCFKQEREKLALTLGEKGIDVRSITVQMS